MRTLAAGSKPPVAGQRGFTLLELLVVVAIIALGSAGVIFSLQDSQTTQLTRDGQRLAALLESARSQSRTLGLPVRWRSVGRGFVFDGLTATPPATQPWLSSDTTVLTPTTLQLGPDPILAPQTVVLASAERPDLQVRVATDGLHPFTVNPP